MVTEGLTQLTTALPAKPATCVAVTNVTGAVLTVTVSAPPVEAALRFPGVPDAYVPEKVAAR